MWARVAQFVLKWPLDRSIPSLPVFVQLLVQRDGAWLIYGCPLASDLLVH